MAPELIRNEPYGKTVDVWSYGVVLWELLTGEVPYRGVEQGAVIFGVAMKSLHLPVPTTAPLGFSLLLKQCWNTEPKHRPACEFPSFSTDFFMFPFTLSREVPSLSPPSAGSALLL